MVFYDVFRFLGRALEEFADTGFSGGGRINRRKFLGTTLMGLAGMLYSRTSEDVGVTEDDRKLLECRVHDMICPKVFGQHWGLWRYDVLFGEAEGAYDWGRVFREIDLIADYANTLVVHSSMFVNPSTGEVYDMPENSMRMDALDTLYYEVKQRHPGLRVMDKLHLEPSDRGPRTKMVFSPGAAKNFFSNSYLDVMRRQAELAEMHDLEFLSVACELNSLVSYTEGWASLINSLRDEYGGKLVYSGIPVDHEVFYDGSRWRRGYSIPDIESVAEISRLVDITGIDFYKPLGWRGAQDVRTMMEHVEPFMRTIEDLGRMTGARFMITETGHNGEDGRHMYPWTEQHGMDRREQANYLTSVFLTTFIHPLIDGVVLYNTTCKYDITGTPAEYALRAAHAMLENDMKIEL